MLLLVGDGAVAGLPPRLVPARVNARYGPEQTLATDRTWADAYGFDVVARLPFNDADSLRAYTRRVVARERRPCQPGENRLRITAGVGGFSPMLDAAIEGAGRRLVSGLVPATYEVTLNKPGDSAKHQTRGVLKRGGLWVWLGHGLRNQLPGVTPIGLKTQTRGTDVAVLLACYAGDFAAPGRCVAEQLLNDDDGPLAVIASTRVSMPYGNARLGGELLAALAESRGETLGGLWEQAIERSSGDATNELLASLDPLALLLGSRESLLATERLEHQQMYCLLGDPLLVVDRTEALPLEMPETMAVGEKLVLRGRAPQTGRLRVEIDRRLGAARSKHAATRLVHHAGRVAAGPFTVAIRLPASWRAGQRLVRVRLESETGMATGAVPLRLVSGVSTARAAPTGTTR